MDKVSYERPREKLQARGASSLSRIELLQVIVGSGNARNSVSSIARKVHALMAEQHQLTIQALLKIPGMGLASASRVVASIELGKRGLNQPVGENHYEEAFFSSVKKTAIAFATLSGNGMHIRRHFIRAAQSESSMVLSRKICAQALADKAHGVVVSIGSRSYSLEPKLFEMGLVEDLKNMTNLMQLNLQAVYLVNKANRAMIFGGET